MRTRGFKIKEKMNDLLEFQKQQIEALRAELKKAYQVIIEMSEVSTECAKHLETIIENE